MASVESPSPSTSPRSAGLRDHGLARLAPPLLALAYAILFLAGLYFVTGLHERPTYPAPGQSIPQILAYFPRNVANVRTSVFLSYAAELFLGAFVAVTLTRMRALEAAGMLASAALFAGFAVAFLQLSSHVAEWVLTFPGLGQAGTLTAYYLSYGLGGPAFSVAMGLFVGLLALLGARARLLPGWVVWSGAVIALIGGISWFNFLIPTTAPFPLAIPLTRFPALLWLVLAGATLRPQVRR